MLHTRLQKPFATDLRGTSALHCESRLERKRKTFKELNRIIRHCFFSLRETPVNLRDIKFLQGLTGPDGSSQERKSAVTKQS